jgi:hypothetical protein
VSRIRDASPDHEPAKILLAAMSPGHLRATKTTVLMRPAGIVDAMKKAGGAEYKGPKK